MNQKKIEEATNEYKIEVKRQGEIEKETSSLKALFNEHEDKLRNRLLELKPFVEAINGNIGLSNKEISKMLVNMQHLLICQIVLHKIF